MTAACLIALSSCSSDDARPASPSDLFGGAGGSGGSTPAGGASGQGGVSGVGGVAGAAGEGGQGAGSGEGGAAGEPPDLCGNGKRDEEEPCEGADLDEQTCGTLGFDGGELACVACELDMSGCTGTEHCWDGLDNDGDGDVDCGDMDCEATCDDPCAQVPDLEDPGTVNGDTWGHIDAIAATCDGEEANSGPEVVFRFVPAITGVADLMLTSSSADLALSVRTTCSDPGSEVACRNFQLGAGAVERLAAPAQQGAPLYVIVDGAGSGEAGTFELVAYSRPLVCGDGQRDPGEACDDGNTDAGDSCSPACELIASELEPNDTPLNANPWEDPFAAEISPEGDVDVVTITAAHPATNLVVDTFDLGDGACTFERMDTVVDIIAADGVTLLATDDDTGAGYCAHATAGKLAAETYYVAVRAAGASDATFPYRLAIAVDWCGNGAQSEVEECDDANTTAGDGCSPSCELE